MVLADLARICLYFHLKISLAICQDAPDVIYVSRLLYCRTLNVLWSLQELNDAFVSFYRCICSCDGSIHLSAYVNLHCYQASTLSLLQNYEAIFSNHF